MAKMYIGEVTLSHESEVYFLLQNIQGTHKRSFVMDFVQFAPLADWSPQTHALFPDDIRAALHQLALVASRYEHHLPPNVLSIIVENLL